MSGVMGEGEGEGEREGWEGGGYGLVGYGLVGGLVGLRLLPY